MAHQDFSKALETEGIDVTLISAGQYKVEGNPYEPLSDDARRFMQSRIDEYYGAFTHQVAKGRKVNVDRVRKGMGQGRVLGADQARAEGMVDGVMPFRTVVSKMLSRTSVTPFGKPASRLSRAMREIAIAGAYHPESKGRLLSRAAWCSASG